MDRKLELFLLFVFSQTLVVTLSNSQDLIGLKSLDWTNKPLSWEGSDPCGSNWEGVDCTKSRVTSIRLSSMGLKGQLSEDIEKLSELQTLDLSYNKKLAGPLPQSIGNLKKLTNLILAGCSFSGQIPGTIGSLQELLVLSLNSNHFSGVIPPSIGNMSKLDWLDLTDNNIEGPIPVSDGSSAGLDMLLHCRHFHLGKNKLAGTVPDQLFSSNMSLIHVLLDSNKLSGIIPSTVGLVQTLEVIDMRNNSFEVSDFPSWFSTLRSLKTLVMDDTQLQGQIPVSLFSLPHLETVKLKNNQLNGTLKIGTSYSSHLRLIDLQKNSITDFENSDELHNVQIRLVENPICQETGITESYCNISVSQVNSPYVTETNNCSPSPCSSDQISSPNCRCAYPYTGTLFFIAPFFSDLGNTDYYKDLEKSLNTFFKRNTSFVDSISLSNPTKYPSEYFEIRLDVFPSGRDHFSRTEISSIGFALSNLTYRVPIIFGPFYFIGDDYKNCAEVHSESKKSMSVVIGAAAGSVALVLLLLAGLYAFHHKRIVERANKQGDLSVRWNSNKSNGSNLQLKGARWFSFGELKKYTNNFSAENDIGSGGYGKVYRGTLPNGKLIAIKRAKRESMQGGLEFRTEIELLSRVHHKNLVTLLGFCFEKGEEMLVYEYVPNGNLNESLSGKSGLKFDWMRRIRVALDTARGLAYLHELVNPPIIHRDIKSTNVLLDDRMNAKVADFGLSKLMGDDEKDHVSTQVKGTMGYLDPEYYMTQHLTEKSDVYSYGVLMLELITARKPIEKGKYIVREVRVMMDRTQDLYNLQALLDPNIAFGTSMTGFERFVDLAMRCVENARVDRPTMSEVVKEIESIMQLAGLNTDIDSVFASARYDESSTAISFDTYKEESGDHSGVFPPPTIDSQ